jgi:hypothetical protein
MPVLHPETSLALLCYIAPLCLSKLSNCLDLNGADSEPAQRREYGVGLNNTVNTIIY